MLSGGRIPQKAGLVYGEIKIQFELKLASLVLTFVHHSSSKYKYISFLSCNDHFNNVLTEISNKLVLLTVSSDKCKFIFRSIHCLQLSN